MLKILSAKNVAELEDKASKYTIEQLGSISISNGHLFLAILVKPEVKLKVTKEEPIVEPKETKVEPEAKPKTPRKRKAPVKKTTS